MDDLQFRRTIYADPNCSDEEVRQAAAEDPAKQEFWNELKQLEAGIQQASRVEVPEGLAERLILRQTMQRHQKQKRRNRVHLALAASVAFAFGVSFTMWQQQQGIDLSEHALAHVYHEADGFALKVDGDVGLTQVNAKLASMGAELSERVGRIYFANYCEFEGVRSFHMVLEGENGKVTVFVIPAKEGHELVERFSDGRMHGEIIDLSKARLIFVGEEGKSFDGLKTRFKKKMLFSA